MGFESELSRIRETLQPYDDPFGTTNPNDVADLNAPNSMEQRPIGSEARKMEGDWVPMGGNSAAAISSANPRVGHFAFWVDDEGSKINVNTADGSDNYTLLSYGQATPMAVNVSVFRDWVTSKRPDRVGVRLMAAGVRRNFTTLSEMATRTELTNATNATNGGTQSFRPLMGLVLPPIVAARILTSSTYRSFS